MTNLRKKKDEIRAEWELCFETTLEEHLTEKGIETFYSEDTSIIQATDMLTKAALMMMFDDANVEGVMVVMHIGSDESDTKEGKEATPYEVERISDHMFYEEKFETEDAARQFIREQAMTTPYTINDFRVVKVCE